MITQINSQFLFFKNFYNDIAIKTVNIGGGTPSALSKSNLALLLKKIRSILSIKPIEFSIEANPESIDDDFFQLCKENSISRISLGIQSLDTTVLQKMGRITSRLINFEALNKIKKNWNDNFNVDLMTGLPGQTKKMILNDIQRIIEYNPCHISLYSLSIEPGTKLEQLVKNEGIISLPLEAQEELWLSGVEFLKKNGYYQYEISNFAQSGKICFHNLEYWKMNPYLGLGPGAVSTIPGMNDQIIRLYNPENIQLFLKGYPDFWNIRYEFLSKKDFLFENLIMGFRLASGINKNKFQQRFGKDFAFFFPKTSDIWKRKKSLYETKKNILLKNNNRFFLNKFLLDIQEELDDINEQKIKISWP